MAKLCWNGTFRFLHQNIRSIEIGSGKVISITQKSVFDDVKKWHVGLIIGIAICVIGLIWVANNSGEDKANTNSIITDSTADAIVKIPKRDTVYHDFFLEQPRKYGTFGMTVSEWNRNLALLTKDGKLRDLKEYDGAYRANISSGSNNEFSISGEFVFPRTDSNTVDIFLRDKIAVNEGILIGIRIRLMGYMHYTDLSSLSVFEKDNWKHIAGSFLPRFSSDKPSSSDFGSIGLTHIFGEEQPKFQHEDNLSQSMNYKCLYGNDKLYSVFEARIEESATAVCDVEMNSRGNNMKFEDRLIRIENANRSYTFLVQTIYSKKQSGLKVDDYIPEDEKRKLEEENKKKKETEDLIKKAVK